MLQIEHLFNVPPQARAFHFGSYGMVVPPAGDTLRALVDRVHLDRVVAYDPNIRLNVEPDLEAWRSTLAWMLPRTHLLKASEEDLGLLWPGRSVDGFIEEALACGTRWVVVTRGAAGAVSATAQGRVTLPAPRVDVVDTVGAGDTFQAALLSWLDTADRLSPAGVGALDGTAQAQALGFAMRAAAITCGRRGADLPRRHELPPA
jgi:fructokinase